MFTFFSDFFFGSRCKENVFTSYIRERQESILNIFYSLLSVILSSYKLNLEQTMDDRYMLLEMILTGRAAVTKYEDETLSLGVLDENNMSRYGRPVSVGLTDYMGKSYGRMIPYDGTNKEYANGVLVYWDDKNIPPIYRVFKYAEKLVNIDCQINAAIKNLRATVVVRCEAEQKKVVEEAWNEASKGLPIILTYKGSSEFGAQPEVMYNNMTGEILKQLQETYDKTLQDFCSEFGVNGNDVINKLSGVSDKELQQNEQLIEIRRQAIYNSIKKGLDMCNEFYGTSLSVDTAYDIENTEEKTEENTEEEADDYADTEDI